MSTMTSLMDTFATWGAHARTDGNYAEALACEAAVSWANHCHQMSPAQCLEHVTAAARSQLTSPDAAMAKALQDFVKRTIAP